MFRWWQKKLIQEQEKAFYQNLRATRFLMFVSEENNDNEKLAVIRTIEDDLSGIRSRCGEQLASPEDSQSLIKINKELRRLYDETPLALLNPFDDQFEPPGGWKFYFKNHSS